MRITIEKDIDKHRERIMWLNEHVGRTTGGRYGHEVGEGWKVSKSFNDNWMVLNAYDIDDEKKAVLFQLRWS